MSGTRRTPLGRQSTKPISQRAVELYAAMGRLRCTCPSPKPVTQGPCPACERWYDLHAELHVELGLKPWEWPCVARQGSKRAGSPAWNEDIAARMTALNEAVRRRAAQREFMRSPELDASTRKPTKYERASSGRH
jgi:hypothetical protein